MVHEISMTKDTHTGRCLVRAYVMGELRQERDCFDSIDAGQCAQLYQSNFPQLPIRWSFD